MGFAINPSLNHLDIPEKYIQEIQQSTAEIVLPDARFRGHPCEAYICISLADKELKAYVALLNTALKSTLVYTSDLVGRTPQEYPSVIAQAEEFVKSLGFTMQKVNLDFSPAMREVIIKGLRVMRPQAPQRKTLLRQPKIEVPDKLVVSTGMAAEGGESADLTELLSLKAELASARAALERVTREKVAADQHHAGERNALKAAAEQAMESKRLAEGRLAQAVQHIKKMEQAASQPRDDREVQRLQEQLATAVAAVAAGDKTREQLLNELQGARERIARLDDDKGRLQQLLAAEEGKRSALQEEYDATKQSMESQLMDALAAGRAAEERLSSMAAHERDLQQAKQLEDELRRKVAAAEDELSAAREDLQELGQRLDEGEEARQKLVETETSLEEVRRELDTLRADKGQGESVHQRLTETETKLDSLRSELAASTTHIQRLQHEQSQILEMHHTAEMTISMELAAARQEIEILRRRSKLVDDLQQQLSFAEAKLAATRGEITRLEHLPAETVASAASGEQLNRLAEEKEAVETEYVRLATESRERVEELSESLAQAEAEVERLTNELEIQSQVAAMEQAALRAELRRLIVGGGAAIQDQVATIEPLPASAITPGGATTVVYVQAPPPVTPPAPQPPAAAAPPPREEPTLVEVEPEEEDDTPDEPITPETAVMQEFTTDFGGFYGGGGASSTEFKIDSSLETIGFSNPDEIIAVFYSSNTVQAVPDGKGIQRCKGYIVATKTADGYRVYVAWYLTESGRVVICLPEQQPADAEECVEILKDAVSYFEIVGFMMEIADLGDTRKSYLKTLKKIPVVKKNATP